MKTKRMSDVLSTLADTEVAAAVRLHPERAPVLLGVDPTHLAPPAGSDRCNHSSFIPD